jgi:flagellar basal body rod protein FlgC
MGLDGIAISGRGALAQAFKIEALVRTIANAGNGQRVGSGKFDVANGQLVGLGQSAVNGQLAGYGEVGQYGDKNGQRVGMQYGEVNGQLVGVLETADMLSALRALEANLQALRIQDATLERTVNELARPAK